MRKASTIRFAILLVFGAAFVSTPAAAADPAATAIQDNNASEVLTGFATSPQPAVAPARSRPAVLPPAYPFWNLQLNLCNSGIAGRYEGGQSVPETQA